MIRAYKEEDKKILIDLIRLNTPQYFDQSEEQDLSNYLDNELEDYYVVDLQSEVIGCGGINYEYDKNTAIISWDIIHPDHQGKGIGIKLLMFRIEKIKTNPDIHQIIVRTSQHTHRYYEKGGFNLDKVEKDYWAKGFDLYQMSIKLK